MSAFTIDHDWYAERARAMLIARTTALAGIYALIRDNPAALTPELAAKIDEIATECARALSKHYNDPASDFTRCPTCGHRPEE